ncbi:hypothetical protein DYB26_005581 [Aphanomyces astaci]|uniref:Uncharacterized protein n=1 Tax=Aphanomyces astaci TaxID=112090 RepID=A0A397B058_APHAT|nr:hypothetical protein DYB36_002305 [Aphanomyces astaci]RHZ29183.1 hypothetical protein DYB26_005581 [Aphanomyces astaci]
MASHNHGEGCCGSHQGGGGLVDYDIQGDDPTLSSCCIKDMKEQAEYVRIQTILQAHDVAEHRLAHRQQATASSISSTSSLFPPTPAISMTSFDPSKGDDDDDDDLDEFDYLLDDNEAATQRRVALEAKVKLQAQGLGIVWGDKEFTAFHTRVTGMQWDALAKHKQNRPTVIAWRATDHESTMVLNAALVACAERYLGTCVYGVSSACSDKLQALCHRRITQHSNTVVFVALNTHSQYLAHVSVTALDDAKWECEVLPWLHKCNVLRETFEATTREAAAAAAGIQPMDKQRAKG